MLMQVETFEETEVSAQGQEDPADEVAMKLIIDLGLTGQVDRNKKTDGGETTTRCPYRVMTAKEVAVYSILFPRKVDVEKYSAGMIPLRVLQVIAHAKELNVYKSIQIWAENTRPKDPILVAERQSDKYSTENHILARWGEALEPFEVLADRALKQAMSEIKSSAEKSIAECQKILASLEAHATMKINGEWFHLP